MSETPEEDQPQSQIQKEQADILSNMLFALSDHMVITSDDITQLRRLFPGLENLEAFHQMIQSIENAQKTARECAAYVGNHTTIDWEVMPSSPDKK